MYETAFGFRIRPFAAAPTTALYYPAAIIEKARIALSRCIEHEGGPGLIVGPAGVGKTLLCQMLDEQFNPRLRVANLASARLCTRRALLQNILFELNLPYRDLEEGELRLSLIDYLANDDRASQGMLLIVDEAHCLPTRLLEEIRMITNLVRNGRPRVQLILAGNARLEERFSSPKLESFNQRVAVRCYLESMGREETKAYVSAQLHAAGRSTTEVFTADALDAVFNATGGVPRLINQVCDHALILANVGGLRTIPASCVEEAWSDLQQLPAPWHLEGKNAETVIEFGRLGAADTNRPAAAVSVREMPGDGLDPLARLTEIEQSVAEASAEFSDAWGATIATANGSLDEDDQFQPAGIIGPEVELVFHGPHAPFDENFVEEEIVIDRYAALESARLAKLRQTPWSRDRLIPQHLAEAARRQDEAHLAAAAAAEPAPEHIAFANAAADPVLPEYDVARAVDSLAVTQPAVTLAVHDEPPATAHDDAPHVAAEESNDDRDLIVVEDDSEPTPPGPTRPSGRVRRQEYRQLFARMRRG